MKRKTLFFLLGLLFLVPLSLRAYDFKSGSLYYNITSDTEPYTVEVTYQTNYTGNYPVLTTAVIPNTVTYDSTTYTVTSIGVLAFYRSFRLTSVSIPESVTSIGNSAFSGCSGLTSITIPESVTSIGEHVFYNCSGLTSITIPESVTSIGSWAFYGCSGLNKTNYTGNIADWCNIVFYDYSNPISYSHNLYINDVEVKDLVIPDGVTTIKNHAFRGCSGLTSITIPESVTSIGEWVFANCSGLTSITIPEGVTSIGNHVFVGCSSLQTVVWNAKKYGNCSMNNNPFSSSSPVTSFIFGESVEHIPSYLCYNMSNLTSVTISESVTSIGSYAFAQCGITHICLPESITSIGSYILQNCPIEYIISLAETPISLEDNMIGLDKNTYDIPLLVPQNSLSAYKASPYWKGYNVQSQGFADITAIPTQTTASIKAKSITFPRDTVQYGRLGYIFDGDTIWNDNLSDSISFVLTGLMPAETYSFGLLTDSMPTATQYTFTTLSVNMRLNTTCTQTTARVSLGLDCGDVPAIDRCGYTYYQSGYSSRKDTVFFETTEPITTLDTLMVGLTPYTRYYVTPFVDINGTRYFKETSDYFTTKDISVAITCGTPTQTTIPLTLRYDFGDAEGNNGINGIEYCLGSQFTEDSNIQTLHINSMASSLSLDTIVRGLMPNTQYAFRPYVEIESTGRKYGYTQTVQTQSVSLSAQRTDRTQTTLSLQFTYNFGDADIDYIGGYLGNTSFRFHPASSMGTIDTTFMHLKPGTQYDFHATAVLKNREICKEVSTTFTTQSVYLGVPRVSDFGQTYAVLTTSCDYGDATALRNILEFKRSQSSSAAIDTTINIIGTQTKVTNLLPNTTYYYRHLLETSEGGTQTTDWQEFTTLSITLTTQIADGISNTSALLHGTVDCDQESYTEIGFEWKRSDAPATVKPQRLLVTDRVDENLLFRLEGLSGDRYYDFRTYCFYQGESYYGEWVGFLTSDKEVLVAPTVQTVGATANEQGAEMEGFIVTGTEPILQKGFEVWIKGGTDVKTTVAEGRIIRALIPEPWSYTTYQYKAYAKTASGTTYGETMEITTGYIPRDVQDIVVTPSSNSAEVTWTEIEVADYYILTLFADEAMTETLAVYRVGTDGSISRLRMPSAVKALVTCSINDLLPDTDYYFAVVAYNGADQKVAEESGTFQTEPDPTGIRQTTDEPATAVRKILYRGQILILRGDKVYTLTGQEIR